MEKTGTRRQSDLARLTARAVGFGMG